MVLVLMTGSSITHLTAAGFMQAGSFCVFFTFTAGIPPRSSIMIKISDSTVPQDPVELPIPACMACLMLHSTLRTTSPGLVACLAL